MKQLLLLLFSLASAFAFSQSNVGIGTTTPATGAILELSSPSKGLLLPRLSTAAMNTLGAAGPDGMLAYNTDQQGLFIRRNGTFVRLSDTSRPFVLPYSGSATNDNVLFQVQNFGFGGAFYGMTSSASNPAIKGESFGFSDGVQGNATSGNGIFGVAASGNGGYFSSTSGHALLTNTGKVGLGTLSPAYQLDVNGRMRIRHAGATPGIWLNKSNNTEGAFIGMVNDTTAGFWGNATSGNWRVAIDVKNGQMGIGTTDPAAPLSFASNVGNKISLWGSATGNHYGVGIQGSTMQLYTDISSSNISFGYGSSTSFSENVKFLGNGNVHIGGYNSWVNAQDNRKINFGDGDYVFLGEQDADDRLVLKAGSFDFKTGDVFVGVTDFTKAAGYKLRVNGKIIAEEVRVQLTGAWPDYVFNEGYQKLTIPQLEQYIKNNKHLPNIPSAAEVENNGQHIGELQKKMMEKIEELSLYIIELKKEIDSLKNK